MVTPLWRLRKQGVEWGAAYEEAQPIQLEHGGTVIANGYRKEGGDYALVLPLDARIELRDGQFYVIIPTAE